MFTCRHASDVKPRPVVRFIFRSTVFVLAALVTVGVFGIGGLLAESAVTTQAESHRECPPSTLLELTSGRCFPVRDVTGNRKQPTLSTSPITPPSLLELRRQQLKGRGPQIPQSMPPPGGIGAGTTYLVGAIQALDSSALYTKMFVQPDGIDPSTLGLEWLFTTATNRTEQGVEVVGIYFQDSPAGSLGIFEWSCSSQYPCDAVTGPVDVYTEPAWIYVTGFASLTCNIKKTIDQGRHVQNVIQYVNKTAKLDKHNPSLWQNAVFLWNSCDNQWDLVWKHRYRASQWDCSVEPIGVCGWWGPILETFPSGSGEPFPEINEVGFERSAILHDGMRSDLSPAETDFDYPADPWLLFHLDPNRGYGVGNNVDTLTKDDCKNGGWRDYGFRNQGQCIRFVDAGE